LKAAPMRYWPTVGGGCENRLSTGLIKVEAGHE
jgi:hypothetical protein